MSANIERFTVTIFFILYLIVGITIHNDFGSTFDETFNRDLGTATYNYIQSRFSDNPVSWAIASQGLLAEFGPFFETLLVAMEKAFNLNDSREIFLKRHLATFAMFWLGTLAFYALLRLRFSNKWICLLGVSLLILTPRLFSHSFYNSKDAVLTALFIIATLTMVRFLQERSILNAILHALACAAAIDVRVVGLLIPALTLPLFILMLRQQRVDREPVREWISLGVFLVCLLSFTVLFWPALWENPVGMFINTITKIDVAKQTGNPYSLYLGSFVRVDHLPWHYIPLWIIVTLPILYIFFFFAGLWVIVTKLAKSTFLSQGNLLNLLFLVMFFTPILAVIIKRPILYDDWRHFYFIQPFLVAIALAGISELLTKPQLKKAVLAATIFMVFHGAFILVRYHPYQNVYFSPLAGKNVEQKFELDYWGISFQEGLNFVLKDQPQNIVKVCVSDYSGLVNHLLLPPAMRNRIQFESLQKATYFLTNHRQPIQFTTFRTRTYPCTNEVYKVNVDGATLLGVFKLR